MSHFDTYDGDTSRRMSDTGPASSSKPMQQFSLAFGLYALWSALAWLSNFSGHTTLSTEAAIILLAGIMATNALFFSLAKTSPVHGLPNATVLLAQGVCGIAWATLYSFLSSGAGEFIPLIYITTLLFAMSNVGQRPLVQLAIFSAVSYSLVIIMKAVLAGPDSFVWPDVTPLVVFAGVTGWVLIYGRHLQELRLQLVQRNSSLQSIIDKMARTAEQDNSSAVFNQRYMMESLTREKGRTDRTNNPFSVCILDIDFFAAFIDEYGSLAAERALKNFSRRIRGELRAMDSANPCGFKRCFGRFGNEEYLVILPQTGLRGAERCGERICEAIRKWPIDETYEQTVSGGVAEYKRGETIPELLARADEALRNAKENGGNRIICSQPKKPRRAEIVPLRKLPS
jgi:diguanylate cyclase (GGDEF)-like protein